MISEERILSLFRSTKKPLAFMEVLSRLGIEKPEGRQLKKLLRRLVKNGNIIRTRKGKYGLTDEMSLIKGIFEAHRDGYGFVIPEEPNTKDLFIPPRSTLGAMEGDRVIARLEDPRRREGRILRVLERAQKKVLGRLEPVRNAFVLKPKRKDITFDLYIAPNDRKGGKAGDLVIADILTYPSDKIPPSGRVVKVLKEPESPREEVDLIIDEYGLSRRFAIEVSKEARSLPDRITDGMFKERKDLLSLPTVTIDGEKAKDFDDAVSIKLRKSGYVLYIHIADVGYFVPWESKIDREARRRATSVYFPDRVIPMLPKKLSEDLCSLKPKVPRLAFTVEMGFSRDGERISRKFYPSVIESDERMTYTLVKEILVDNNMGLRSKYSHLLGEFELMGELCSVLRARRLKRGSLDFDLPEPEVLLDMRGNPEDIIVSERNFAHMIVEEFMIAANEAVAEHLYRKGVPALYRIHEEPDVDKLEDILKVLKTVSRLKKRSLTPGDLPSLLDMVRGRPEEEVINYMILRSLKQARYSPQNAGHFGLGSECYTHFTSPIRRYPDLVVHRVLRELLSNKKLSVSRIEELNEILPNIAFHSSRMERQADDAERSVIAAMRAWFMKDMVGEELEGRIVGVTPHGIKVRLKEFYVDGFLHVSYMTDDYYIYDDRNLQLVGRRTRKRFSIGSSIKVRIDRVDIEEREIIFGLSET